MKRPQQKTAKKPARFVNVLRDYQSNRIVCVIGVFIIEGSDPTVVFLGRPFHCILLASRHSRMGRGVDERKSKGDGSL